MPCDVAEKEELSVFWWMVGEGWTYVAILTDALGNWKSWWEMLGFAC